MIETKCTQCKSPNPTNNFFVCCGEYTCDKCYNLRFYLPACPACGQTNQKAIKNNDEQELRQAYTRLADGGHLGAIGRLDSLLAFLSSKYPDDKELIADSRKYVQLNIDKCHGGKDKLDMSLDEQRELKAEMTGLLFSGMTPEEMQKEMERRVLERQPKVRIRNVSQCGHCDKEGATHVCPRCDITRYCNRTCQKAAWKKHKKTCGKKKDWAMVSSSSTTI